MIRRQCQFNFYSRIRLLLSHLMLVLCFLCDWFFYSTLQTYKEHSIKCLSNKRMRYQNQLHQLKMNSTV